ncbi:MAG: ABC transporter permease [Candidatus Bipolaricaulis anaerobius]|uniref:Dipeptide ABC transporter, permease protein n=1 Tax=Candidatus Bipolaricaulis anaerobius TaxID=2026885 RepID=A0A2X3KYE4_9BACT|nr:ABC transporter permease [Candidatus Bipolaricaulis sp.]MDD2912581.1 ABC transporter permease [Candidatus Bipolaricaulis anaerobius]MDD5763945.1 ABC transporter permease [Candidatus Bipolaricaulis anaerobius]SQD92536.1 dipeptide ABC transporter, permease protein [Candidatus Bipolaricaulis anaerobius]HOD73062.1 ABC transporter permease [Candidatus Bipolaricaulis anaerobius]
MTVKPISETSSHGGAQAISRIGRGARLVARERILLVGIVIVSGFIIMTILGQVPGFTPYDPMQYRSAPRLQGPSAQHWMGTDQLQRDVFSRVISGGKASLIVAFSAVAISMVGGSVLGWISGFFGGWLDRGLSLAMDALYSFPSIILAITLVVVLGAGLQPMIWSVAIVYVPTYFRVSRAEVLKVRETTYIEAIRAVGASRTRIVLRHMAPNTVNAIMAVSSFNLADAILTVAALSFLGFGLPPPAPDWGFDIQNGQKYLQSGSWWLITFPGLMIVFLSLGFGLIGEGVSDLVNPKRRHKI